MTSKRARFVTYGEQVDLVRHAPRAAALGMRTVPGTWQSHPVVRSQRGDLYPLNTNVDHHDVTASAT